MKTLIDILGFIFAIIVMSIALIIATVFHLLKEFSNWYKKYGKWE